MAVDCAGCRSLLAGHIEGALPEEQRQAMTTHLEACATCRAAADEERRTRDAIRSAAPDLDPAFLQQIELTLERPRTDERRELPGRLWKPLALAASLLVLATILWVIFSAPAPREGVAPAVSRDGVQANEGGKPADQELDATTKKRLEEILKGLDEEDVKLRDAAQGELEKFLDDDAKADLVRKTADKGERLSKEQVARLARALKVYERKTAPRITFLKDGQICIMNADGSEAKELTPEGLYGGPTFTPDGKRIAFGFWKAQRTGFGIMDADGKNERELSAENADNAGVGHFAVSPDGQKIAFVSFRDGRHLISTIDVDGKNLTKGASSAEFIYAPIRFSPDGRRVAFARGGALCISDTDGKNEQVLELGLCPGMPAFCFSPDGKRIAFASVDFPVSRICIVDADGSKRIELTHTTQPLGQVVFSPDGKRVVYVRGSSSSWSDIFVVGIDGKDPRRLTASENKDWSVNRDPAISPDGQRVVFTRYHPSPSLEDPVVYRLCVVGMDGTGEAELGEGQLASWGPRVPAKSKGGRK